MKRIVVTFFTLCFLLYTLPGCTRTVEYTVQAGDSLSSIAIKFGTTVTDLVNLNADQYPQLRTNPAALRPGMKLQVLVPTALGERVLQLVDQLANRFDPALTPTPNANPTIVTTGDKAQTVDTLVWQMVNQARNQTKRGDLQIDVTLQRIAVARSEDLVRRSYFSHNDPATGKVMFEELLKANRYGYLIAGENIAEIKNEGVFVPSALAVFNRYTAQEIANQFVTGWLNSPEHRDNIMNGKFRRTGVAMAVIGEGTRIVATQVFSD
jgi:uncharacterized protein YkwD